MKYKEYTIRLGNVSKRLGVLGESHTYTSDESSFAKKVVQKFDTLLHVRGLGSLKEI